MGVGKLLALVYRIVVARYLGPDSFGVLSAGIAIATLGGALATIGMNMGIARFVAYSEDTDKQLDTIGTIKKGLYIVLIIASTFCLLLICYSQQVSMIFTHSYNAAGVIILFAFGIPFIAGTNFMLGVIRGAKSARLLAALTDVLPNLGRLAGAVVVVCLGFSYIGIALSNVIVRILILPITFFAIIKNNWFGIKKYGTKSYVGKLVRFSLPLSFGVIGKLIRQEAAEVLIIGYFAGPIVMGLYVATTSFSKFLTFFLLATNRMLMPYIASAHGKQDADNLSKLYTLTAKWNMAIILPVFAVLMYTGPELAELIFGEKYIEAGYALRFLLPGILVNVSLGSFGEVMQGVGKTKQLLWIMLFQTVCHLALIVSFMPIWGLKGAVAGRGLSLALTAGLGCILLWNCENLIPFTKKYFLILLLGFLILGGIGACIMFFIFKNLNFLDKNLVLIFLTFVYFLGIVRYGIDKEETSRFWKKKNVQ